MQFTVPQFIDVENKIIGPITTRQFLIFLGAALIIALTYRLADFSLFIFITIIIAGLAIVFAFVKINGHPFHFFVLNLVQTLRKPNIRVWNNRAIAHEDKEVPVKVVKSELVKEKRLYTGSHLSKVALILDTQGKYKGER